MCFHAFPSWRHCAAQHQHAKEHKSRRFAIAVSCPWARSLCRSRPQLAGRQTAMFSRPLFPARWMFEFDRNTVVHAPEPTLGPMPAAGPASDVFGYRPMAWHRGEQAAWDVFGFRIYTRTWTPRPDVEVLVTDNRPWRPPSWSLITGVVTGMYHETEAYVIVKTAPTFVKLCQLGREYVVSVRSVKHWVSRRRRGLRRLRRGRAHMVLAHKLPGAPKIVAHVQAFL